ncbi:arad-like aldolase/epimerase [Daedalea quercina L-15889]|uniref:Arad-like aldolase/epimerase n=1 Tax=Daedalea quercina L-15889 TaxID=1314783 RepID=A0A165LIE9_9APHY|nr:arad-like aldolase/epimerase [Daedalea quercina L-15889]
MAPPPTAVETQIQTLSESITLQLKGVKIGDPRHASRDSVPKRAIDSAQESPRETIGHGDVVLAPIPTKFNSIHEERAYLTAHLAAAFRYWARAGFTEGMAGHISVRDPELTNAIWLNPLGIHYGLLKASDMVLVDMDTGKILGGNRKRPVNEAGFLIHRAVHQARPDVHAAAHCHTVAARAFSTFQRPLRMLTQDSCNFYGDAQAVYTNYGGIVLGDEEGRKIATALGANAKGAILMNHGLLTVGKTVDEACYLFGLMERSCDIELKAMVGEARGEKLAEISPEEAAWNQKTSSDPEVLYWDFQPEYDFEYEACNGKFDDFRGL